MQVVLAENQKSGNMCSQKQTTTMQDSFKKPRIKKPDISRARRFHQFFWDELYSEYIRNRDAEFNINYKNEISVYRQDFTLEAPKPDPARELERRNQFPLYCSKAITCYNTEGDMTLDHKRRYVITRPAWECREQFG